MFISSPSFDDSQPLTKTILAKRIVVMTPPVLVKLVRDAKCNPSFPNATYSFDVMGRCV
ncbi:hypothetical protein ANO14919_069090 [Xylariales sp. No.14919]|nr:hypothetical protein ANO14919_069090 [Xylariales sp. No.14919]